MKTPSHPSLDRLIVRVACVAVAGLLTPSVVQAQGKKNPTSKVYIADVSGEAQIDIGDMVQDVAKKAVYNAQGTIIETKKAEKEEDKNKIFSTVVYSNGTGAYFDQDTKVELKKFIQEPFTPNRADMDVEPSISQTQAFISRGAVGLCTSKQVAGSNLTYQTPHGSVNIRGRRIVIETNDEETKISMIEGDSTVRAGAMDMGGHTLRAGDQAIIRPGAPGGPNLITIRPIPGNDMPLLDDKVAMACLAKKTVYFEVREKRTDGVDDRSTAGNNFTATDGGTVTAFDGTNPNGASSPGGGEIVVVPTVPNELPVQFTVSPANLTSTSPGSE
ncbi:MAG: hypothetical protein NTV51_25105 [Verrucomicrobia bacterium]|nr:hypothetical protein [Verrucomicrobiota bacterium]